MYETSACGANALIQLKSLFEFDTEKLTTGIEFLQDLLSMRFFLIRFGFMVCGFTYIVTPHFSTEVVRHLHRNMCYNPDLRTGSFLLPSTTHRYTNILKLKQISIETYYSKIAYFSRY